MFIKCQQQDILKIRDRIPGHGRQVVLYRLQHYSGSERVQLVCGCSLPMSWLPEIEREVASSVVPLIPIRPRRR